jgi:hypothetical protein
MNKFSSKRLRAGALDAKLQAVLRRQVPVTLSQRRLAAKAGFSVGTIMHTPVGTKKGLPYVYFYMRRGQFERFVTGGEPERGRRRS